MTVATHPMIRIAQAIRQTQWYSPGSKLAANPKSKNGIGTRMNSTRMTRPHRGKGALRIAAVIPISNAPSSPTTAARKTYCINASAGLYGVNDDVLFTASHQDSTRSMRILAPSTLKSMVTAGESRIPFVLFPSAVIECTPGRFDLPPLTLNDNFVAGTAVDFPLWSKLGPGSHRGPTPSRREH